MISQERHCDILVVGTGTAGSVLAARLSEDAGTHVIALEWGPSDRDEPRALEIRRWFEMLEGEYDLDYRSVPQRRGNSNIRQSRARILGGCSTHNTMIAFRPLAADLRRWEALGATGWGPDAFLPWFDRLATRLVPVAAEHRNPYLEDVVRAAHTALGVPVIEDWNRRQFTDGAGFLTIGYTPETGIRESSSVAYLHGIMDTRPNLEILLETRALRIVVEQGRAVAVDVRRKDGSLERVHARREVVLACGAIDTPRLMQLSGLGDAKALHGAGIAPVTDLPGVGANLMDHPEALVVFEAACPPDPRGATDWDIAVFARTDPAEPGPDVMMHVPLMTYAVHAEALGYATPENSLSITPNVPRPRSRGTVSIASPDLDAPPRIDYRYLEDPEGYDERMLIRGVRLARRLAAASPMREWIARETFPGPGVESDEDLGALIRQSHHTVYHVSGTCRMGARDDPRAVVDPQLRVRGIEGLRIADASVFPELTTVNPVATILMVAERAAAMMR